MTDDLDQMGPIDYLVVEFPGNKMTGEAFPILIDLAIAVSSASSTSSSSARQRTGRSPALSLTDIDGDGELDLTVFAGRVLGPAGHQRPRRGRARCSSRAAPPACSSTRTVWAAPFATALRRSGGQLVASGRIPVQAILAAPGRRRRGQLTGHHERRRASCQV